MKTTKISLLCVGLFSILLWSSCLKDDDSINDYPVAGLKMVNAYAPAAAVVYALDNNYLQSSADPLLYKKYSGLYANVFTGNRRLRIVPSSANNMTIVDTIFTFQDSTLYTSFVYGDDSRVRHLIVEDQPVSNLGDESAVRFLHLASNTGAVNVYIGSETSPVFADRALDEDVEENDHEVFEAHASGKQLVSIKNAAGTVLVEREHDFAEDVYYSIILIGDQDATDTPLYLGIVAH